MKDLLKQIEDVPRVLSCPSSSAGRTSLSQSAAFQRSRIRLMSTSQMSLSDDV